jgi:hypothetical protein
MEIIHDEISAMQRQASEFYHAEHQPQRILNQNNAFRPFMVQWMLTIHDTFQLSPVVVSTALYYLDHTPCANTPLDYQLCGLTSLHLAVKVHETRIFQLKQLLEMGNVCFTERKVLEMETRILTACNWKLHPPVPEAFVYVFGKLFAQSPQIPSAAFYILRQGMQVPVLGKPSIIAYASLLVAMEQSCISVELKQKLCVNVLQVSGFSATTRGLPEAFKALTGPRCASPTTSAHSVPQATHRMYPVQAPLSPLVVQQTPPNGDPQNLISPESREEGEYREVITCADDGIEVIVCSKPDAQILDSISPRNVEDFDIPVTAS